MQSTNIIFRENKGIIGFVFISSVFLLFLVVFTCTLFYNGKIFYEKANYININVIWQSYCRPSQISEAINKLIEDYNLIFVKNISREQIKEDLLKNIKVKDFLLTEIEFPVTTVFKLKYNAIHKQQVFNTLKKIESFPLVRGVVFSKTKISLLKNWQKIASTLILPVLLGLSIIVLVLIFLSLRLLLLDKREEIEILYLVGASDFYVLKPLILFSSTILVISCFTSSLLVYVSVNYLKKFFLWFGIDFVFLPPTYLTMLICALFFISILASLTAFKSFQNIK